MQTNGKRYRGTNQILDVIQSRYRQGDRGLRVMLKRLTYTLHKEIVISNMRTRFIEKIVSSCTYTIG